MIEAESPFLLNPLCGNNQWRGKVIRWHGTHAYDKIRLVDNKRIAFGNDQDAYVQWNGSVLELIPLTDDTGAFNIGNGTKDMDVKIFLGSVNDYVLFDVGNQALTIAGAVTLTLPSTLTVTGAVLFNDKLTIDTEYLHMYDSKSIYFGEGLDFYIKESSTAWVFGNATSDVQMEFGVSGAGMKYLFYMKTSGYYVKFDDGQIVLSESYIDISGSRGVCLICGGTHTDGIRFGTGVTNAFDFGAGGPITDAGHSHNTAAGEIQIDYDGGTRYIRTWKT